MGSTYFKALGMVLSIQVVAAIVTVIVALVTSPFALPFVGNLPTKFIDGTITFYFNLVIACLLGLSLYKCADRLDIALTRERKRKTVGSRQLTGSSKQASSTGLLP